MIKEQANKIIQNLPDDATWDDLMAEIYFKQNVDKGLSDLTKGKTLSHDEAKKRLAKWLT